MIGWLAWNGVEKKTARADDRTETGKLQAVGLRLTPKQNSIEEKDAALQSPLSHAGKGRC